jgi:cytochrome P450
MVEQTWTLAADMICKALFDRDMPFNPHVVFKCVKTYTDVMNHKDLRLKRKLAAESSRFRRRIPSKAVEAWVERTARRHRRRSARGPRAHAAQDDRAGDADPSIPEFDEQQAIDEIKQYLWAGTETTALTLAWALYLSSQAIPRWPSASAARANRSTATANRPPPTIRPSPTPAPSSRRRCASIRRFGADPRCRPSPTSSAARRSIRATASSCSAYGAHHNPKYWEDPETFRPERWMGERGKEAGQALHLPPVRRR